VIDIVRELESYQANVSICDPWAEPARVKHEYGIVTTDILSDGSIKYDAVILAVAHDDFNKLNIRELVNKNSVIYDVKGVLTKENFDARL
jgi:UDP-N-acetyl-D-galactosamine dehydrogenase